MHEYIHTYTRCWLFTCRSEAFCNPLASLFFFLLLRNINCSQNTLSSRVYSICLFIYLLTNLRNVEINRLLTLKSGLTELNLTKRRQYSCCSEVFMRKVINTSPSISSWFKMSAATASTSNSQVLCGSTPFNIKELWQHKHNRLILSMLFWNMHNHCFLTALTSGGIREWIQKYHFPSSPAKS